MIDKDEHEQVQYEGDLDLIEDIVSSDYVADIMAVVRQHIEQFFNDKSMYCGGPIPKTMLYSTRRISQVANTDISRGIDAAYQALEKVIDPEELEKAEKFGTVTEDIRLVNQVLETLAHSNVPKCLAGGIMLMYLESCEGVKFS